MPRVGASGSEYLRRCTATWPAQPFAVSAGKLVSLWLIDAFDASSRHHALGFPDFFPAAEDMPLKPFFSW
jgi:hypothetical protein